jgi:hypothetical protein
MAVVGSTPIVLLGMIALLVSINVLSDSTKGDTNMKKINKTQATSKLTGLRNIVQKVASYSLLTVWAIGTSWTSGLVPISH